jgi:hypothetical protein
VDADPCAQDCSGSEHLLPRTTTTASVAWIHQIIHDELTQPTRRATRGLQRLQPSPSLTQSPDHPFHAASVFGTRPLIGQRCLLTKNRLQRRTFYMPYESFTAPVTTWQSAASCFMTRLS